MKPKTQPASAPAEAPVTTEEAARLVKQREGELTGIKTDIIAAEASLPELAAQDDDDVFESASLAIERLKRAELRATKRLEQARTTLAEAEAREEQSRRRALFEEGRKAAAEADRLVSKYGEHAAAVADVFRAIDKLRASVEAANESLPQDERAIDTHAFEIYRRVELPATTKAGEAFWYRPDYYGYTPLNPHPQVQIVPQPVFANGRWVFNEDDDYAAAKAAEESRPWIAPVTRHTPIVQSQHGERIEDGKRVIRLPACEWPPKPINKKGETAKAAEAAKQSDASAETTAADSTLEQPIA